MKVLLYPLWLLYRIWFYVLMFVPIIILFPFIFVSILSEKTYPLFFKIARIWAKFILIGMGFRYSIEGDDVFEDGKSYMLVANHTSMTDIMLMLIAVKNHPFVFVGKKELVKIPIFGFIYKRVCILVDRKSSKSRYEVFERAQKRIQQGLSICIFPEGGVPDESVLLDEFKDGAFVNLKEDDYNKQFVFIHGQHKPSSSSNLDATHNIMSYVDYDTQKRNYLWKWQWDIIRK